MNLQKLKDRELLEQTKQIAQDEREILTKMLRHLKEVNRRKLYCDLGYHSLFEYAVKELKYSEGQAGRRIQAMRLMQEIPEIEQRIENGCLNLTNVSQAQSYFREAKRAEMPVAKTEKLALLKKLENKSSREAQALIQDVAPFRISKNNGGGEHFITSDTLRSKLAEVRSLLGYKGSQMSLSELIEYMAGQTIEVLKAKKFGKKRVREFQVDDNLERPDVKKSEVVAVESHTDNTATPAPELRLDSRHIPRLVKYEVWKRDKGKCRNCKSQKNLNFDHIQPFALGGGSVVSNLMLLCFQCNQRRGFKTFGIGNFERRQRN